MKNPLLGVGPSKVLVGSGVRFSDSGYMLTLRSYGLVGLGLWLWFLGSTMWRAVQVVRAHRGTHAGAYGVGIICALVGIMTVALASDDAFAGFKPMVVLPVCAGALLGVLRALFGHKKATWEPVR